MSRRTPPAASINSFVERARHLYSLPAVAMRVLELTNQPTVDARKLKDCIENDPALTGKILRVVNSSLFGLAREVTDLNQALALLGTKPLKLLVLGFSLPPALLDGQQAEILTRYWQHTLTKAVAGRELSERFWKIPGDEAFIAGLLQEIGVLVLLQDLGQPYAELLERVRADGAKLAPAEMAALGFDHGVLSGRLLDHWGLPELLVRAVGLPHDAKVLAALPAERQPLPQILHLAEQLALVLAADEPPSGPLAELLEVGGLYRGLTIKQVEAVVAELGPKVAHLADVFSFSIPDLPDYAAVLARAHEQLADVALDAAQELARKQSTHHWQRQIDNLGQAAEELAEVKGSWVDPASAARAAGEGLSTCVSSHSAGPAACAVATAGTFVGVATEATPLRSARREVLSDVGLVGRLETAVASCRQARRAVSLVLIEIDHYGDLIVTRGLDGAAQVVRRLRLAIDRVCEPGDARYVVDDGQVALILEGCERRTAVEMARDVVRLIRGTHKRVARSPNVVTVSAGVATLPLPPKNFPAAELLDSAQRCLNAAHSSGGDAVKSIDL